MADQTCMLAPIRHTAITEPDGLHVLLVAPDQRARYTLADLLLSAGFHLTLCATDAMAGLLLEDESPIDLLLAAQPDGEPGGLARLARALRPDVPILLIDQGTAAGAGVLEAVHDTMDRWPVRV